MKPMESKTGSELSALFYDDHTASLFEPTELDDGQKSLFDDIDKDKDKDND